MGKFVNEDARKKQDGRDNAHKGIGKSSEAGDGKREIALGKTPCNKAEYNKPCIVQRNLDAQNFK